MPNETTEPNDRELISITEFNQRNPRRFATLLKLRGWDVEDVDPSKLSRPRFRRFLEDCLAMGMNMVDMAEMLNMPDEGIPFLIMTILGTEKMELLKRNNAEMTKLIAGQLGPLAIAQMTRIMGDDKARPADKIKAAEVAGKFAGQLGPDTVVNNNQASVFMPSPEMMERYNGTNLEKLLGRKIEINRGAGEDHPELGEPEDGEADAGSP